MHHARRRAGNCNLLLRNGFGGSLRAFGGRRGAGQQRVADIAAWRLMEGWAIDLVDAQRRTRVRFGTPDENQGRSWFHGIAERLQIFVLSRLRTGKMFPLFLETLYVAVPEVDGNVTTEPEPPG